VPAVRSQNFRAQLLGGRVEQTDISLDSTSLRKSTRCVATLTKPLTLARDSRPVKARSTLHDNAVGMAV
jgi:hypothetical protein